MGQFARKPSLVSGAAPLNGEQSPPEITTCVDGYRMTMRHQRVTPQLASQWLEHCEYEKQRNLRDSNLDFLENEMRKDRFLPNSMLTFWLDKGDVILLDGRHRLNALIKVGKAEYFWVQTISSEFDLSGIVYSVIDIGSPRSSNDGLKALDAKIPQAWLGKSSIAGALRRVKDGFSPKGQKPAATDLITQIDKWFDAIDLYGESIRGGYLAIKYMRASRLQAAGFITCRHQPILAQQFWNGISYDDGLKHGDPRKYIAKNIIDDNHVLRHLGHRHEKSAGQLLAYVWNKFFRGESLENIRMPSPDAPIIFEGTPYNTALPNCGID